MATSLIVEIGANLARMQSDLNRMNRMMDTATQSWKSMFKTVGLALGAAFSVRAIQSYIMATVDAADQTAKMSQRLGIAVEQLSAYRYMAELSGISFEGTAKGIQQLSKNMLIATEGTNEASRAFAALGINLKDNQGRLRENNEVLEDVADRFSKMRDGTQKTAYAMTIFGKAGTELIPMLNQGRKGLMQMENEARKLGIIISTDFAKNAEQFNDNMTRLKSFASATAIIIAGPLVKAMNLWLETLLRWKGIEMAPTAAGLEEKLDNIRKRLEGIAKQSQIAATGFQAWGLEDIIGEKVGKEQIKLLAEYASTLKQLETMRQKATIIEPVSTPAIEKVALNYKDINLELAELWTNLARAGEIGAPVLQDQIDGLDKMLGAWIENRKQVALLGMEFGKLKTSGSFLFYDFPQVMHDTGIIIQDGVLVELPKINTEVAKINDTAHDLGMTFSSAFEDAIVEGKKFSDVLKGLYQDVLRIAAREWLTEPGGEYLGKLFSNLPGLIAGLFHQGGIVGMGGMSRMVPAMAFADAPRAHGGAFIGSDEVPIIAQKGETILKKGAVGSSIQVTNYNDFRGVDPSMKAWLLGQLRQSEERTKTDIIESRNRRGEFSRGR